MQLGPPNGQEKNSGLTFATMSSLSGPWLGKVLQGFFFIILERLRMTFTANGKRETAGSYLSQKRENSLIFAFLVSLRSCLISGANRTEMS